MGRLRVKKPFVDKYDHKVAYKPGQLITIDDPDREKDLISRGLCAAVKVKTSDKKDDEIPTSEPASEAEMTETSEEGAGNQPEE